jgi:hypothetical protein
MIVYRGMPIRQGNEINQRIQGRQGNILKAANVNLTPVDGYQTTGISTSEDPAVAFVYACHYANAMGGSGGIYAIWITQGPLYRGIDVRQISDTPAVANMGGTTQQQSIINQKELVLQSVASHQIIGWYNVIAGNPSRLGVWTPQPHWQMNNFNQAIIDQARNTIETIVNAKYPTGLSHARRAGEILVLTGPNPGVGF